MFKLNRRTEYALLALRYLSVHDQGLSSVRAVAEHYKLPEPLLAKVLQRLKRGRFVSSTKGSMGGYRLAQTLESISLTDILQLFDESTGLVGCIQEAEGCDCHLHDECELRDGMNALHTLLLKQVQSLSVASFFKTNPVGVSP